MTDPDSSPTAVSAQSPSIPPLWRWGGLLLLCLLTLVIRLTPNLDRPFEQDELVSLKNFTALGYEDTAEENRAASKVSPMRVPKGWAKAFLNSWGTNHHITNNLCVPVMQGTLGMGEGAARMPSLLASVALVGVLYTFVLAETGSLTLALVLGAIALFHPYMMFYGQAVRGYAMALVLMAVQVMVIRRNLLEPVWWRHVLSVVLGFALFSNLVVLLIMWLVPLYAVLLWQNRRKKEWWLEAGGVMALCAVFILSHLPDFLHEQAKYGVRIRSLAEFRQYNVLGYLTPGLWIIPAVAGFAGWIVGALRRDWLSLVALGSTALISVYVVAMHKIPYDRTFGLYLGLGWLGIVRLWLQWEARAVRLGLAAVLLVPVLAAVPAARGFRSAPTYSDVVKEMGGRIKSAGETKSGLVLLPWIYGEESRYYLPAGATVLNPAGKPAQTKLYLACEQVKGKTSFRTQYADMAKQEYVFWTLPEKWAGSATWELGGFRIVEVPVKLGAGLPAEGEGEISGVVYWQAADRYFQHSKLVADRLKAGQGPWTARVTALPYGAPPQVFIPFATREEARAAAAITRELDEHGKGVIFTALAE